MSAEQAAIAATEPPAEAAVRIARELFEHSPDWVVFYREIFGVEGVLRKLFRTPEELQAFETTEAHGWLLERLSELRKRGEAPTERTTVITVRLPQSLHNALREEARDRRTSINQLAISCLLRTLKYEAA